MTSTKDQYTTVGEVIPFALKVTNVGTVTLTSITFIITMPPTIAAIELTITNTAKNDLARDAASRPRPHRIAHTSPGPPGQVGQRGPLLGEGLEVSGGHRELELVGLTVVVTPVTITVQRHHHPRRFSGFWVDG